MTHTDALDTFFSMLEDHDVDFVGSNDHPDVPVLTYRWCRNDMVADCPVRTLVDAGEKSMKILGLKRVVRHDHHLRGDTEFGQRVKMTVLRSGKRTMFLLMAAGMPGTRKEAKAINAKLAEQIEQRVREWNEKTGPEG